MTAATTLGLKSVSEGRRGGREGSRHSIKVITNTQIQIQKIHKYKKPARSGASEYGILNSETTGTQNTRRWPKNMRRLVQNQWFF